MILDLFSRHVVGFAMSHRITQELALHALDRARAQRPGIRDLIHHSDRGSQYASHAYRRALEQAGITCSMSRRGNCWDNAVAERFFATLKVELLHGLPLPARATAECKIIEYIEDFYNVRRRHSSLDYLSPMAFELQHATRRALGARYSAGVYEIGAGPHRQDGEPEVRRILGVLSLCKRHGIPRVDDACGAALALELPSYQFVKRYLARQPALPLSLKQVDPLIRELTHDRDLIDRRTEETSRKAD